MDTVTPATKSQDSLDGFAATGEPGLTSSQAAALLGEHGPNLLVPKAHHGGILDWLWRSAKEPMVLLLIVAAFVYLVTGDAPDAVVTAVAMVPIATVGLVLEQRSARALDRLRALTSPTARVLRDGVIQPISAEQIVPGDVIFVREGDVIPADARLLDGSNVLADESALTGEPFPVEKTVGPDVVLLAGTTLVAGRGAALVGATGGRTEYGRVGRLVAEVKQPPTPLERLVRRFTTRLLLIALAFCVLVALAEFARGRGLAAGLIAGVSLAMAAVPEEFPMVYTLYLALGAWRLARSNALVRRLSGVEGLGAASVICTDKTGTLTEGRLTLAALRPLAEEGSSVDERSLLEAALLACEPNPFDPLDVVIAEAARTRGLDSRAKTLVRDYGFDVRARYLSHVWRSDGGFEIAAKGALEGIIARTHASPQVVAAAEKTNATLAGEGMRVLAVAAGRLHKLGSGRQEDERPLQFMGLIAFSDPIRPGVREAIRECRTAGIRVVMITGDHPVTALAVARALELGDGRLATGADLEGGADQLARTAAAADVFARIRPEQKYALVRELRRQGAVVAMTGDGINDAPALREADIGVAMGQRGTEVAREAATLVLLDDNFATIVSAVREGRRIFDNLRKAFGYLIAFHLPLLLTAFVVPLLGAPLLLLPVHLVLLELFIHPAVSLVFEGAPPRAGVMRQPPRPPSEFLLPRRDLSRALIQGVVLSAGVIALYLWRLGVGEPGAQARSAAFVAMLVGQIALLVIERTRPEPVWRALPHLEPVSVAVLLAAAVGLLLAIYLPPLAGFLKLVPLTAGEWALALLVGFGCTIWAEPLKFVRRAGKA